jgi:hypothetical protein
MSGGVCRHHLYSHHHHHQLLQHHRQKPQRCYHVDATVVNIIVVMIIMLICFSFGIHTVDAYGCDVRGSGNFIDHFTQSKYDLI